MYTAFEHAISSIDVAHTRRMAEQYSWESLVDTVLLEITRHLASRGHHEG
jgi:hypothetical protein